MKYSEIRKKYFKEEGLKTIRNLLENYVEIYNKGEAFPLNNKILGFPNLMVKSREELKFRAIELGHILGITLQEETEIIKRELKIKDGN